MDTLFGADGIRGTIDRYPLRAPDLSRLGYALATAYLQEHSQPRIILGCDTRESCQSMKTALADGLTEAGISVVDVGVIPTAGISYLIAKKGLFNGGIMISASHNPVEENGIKVFDSQGAKINSGTEEQITSFFNDSSKLTRAIHPASCTDAPGLVRHYTEELAEESRDFRWNRRRIVVDCSNGAASYLVGPILETLGCGYILVNAAPDGVNINLNGGSESVRIKPQQMLQNILRFDAEFGVAFDGDADRIVIVDREGKFYDGDLLLAILAIHLHRNSALPNKVVVTTQMHNTSLDIHLKDNYNIEVSQVKNGDKNITRELIDKQLVLGGEPIGHIIVHDNPYRLTGDGIRTLLKVIQAIIRKNPDRFSDLTEGFKKLPQVNVAVHLGERMATGEWGKVNLEGIKQCIRAEIGDLNLFEARMASTEPVFRIMMEAKNTPVEVLAGYSHALGTFVQESLGKAGQEIIILDCVNGGMMHSSKFAAVLEKARRTVHQGAREQGYPPCDIP